MDEKRKYFRLQNRDEIQAQYKGMLMSLIDISASSAAISNNINLPPSGIFDLKINNFSMRVNYEILRITAESIILIFNVEEQINQLFVVLKNLRDEQNKRFSEKK